MSKTLFYGFGPYQEFSSNITVDIIKSLPKNNNHSFHIFDVKFDQLMFETILNIENPNQIIGLGQCRQGDKLRIESYAINTMCDRESNTCQIDDKADQNIKLNWELPITEICETSTNAGNYVCNYSMWIVSNWAKANNAKFAFIHIPQTFSVNLAKQYLISNLKP